MQMHKSKIEEDGNGKGRSTFLILAFQHSWHSSILALPSTFIPRLATMAIPGSTFGILH